MSMLSDFKIYIPYLLLITASMIAGFSLHFFIYKILSHKKQDSLLSIFFNYMKGPLYIILPLFFMTTIASFLKFTITLEIINLVIKILLFVVTTWSLIKLIDYSDILIVRKYQFDKKNLDHAEIITKYRLLKNVAKIIVFIFTVSLLLLSFENVREIGKGILLSASVIGAIVAFGAQKLISDVISGFQLAFTKPLKIGDALIIEGEMGTVEEVTLTNVTLCLWDLRRLILPLSSLIDKPFINLTYPDTDLIGPIFFYTDYDIDVNELRTTLNKIVDSSPLWDKKTCNLEVTDLKEHTMQLRATVSARNNTDLWGLSCYIREKIIEFIRNTYPKSLPKLRTKIYAEPK